MSDRQKCILWSLLLGAGLAIAAVASSGCAEPSTETVFYREQALERTTARDTITAVCLNLCRWAESCDQLDVSSPECALLCVLDECRRFDCDRPPSSAIKVEECLLEALDLRQQGYCQPNIMMPSDCRAAARPWPRRSAR